MSDKRPVSLEMFPSLGMVRLVRYEINDGRKSLADILEGSPDFIFSEVLLGNYEVEDVSFFDADEREIDPPGVEMEEFEVEVRYVKKAKIRVPQNWSRALRDKKFAAFADSLASRSDVQLAWAGTSVVDADGGEVYECS